MSDPQDKGPHETPSSLALERPKTASRPSLLPAFEPLSSSPTALPRPPKRDYNGSPTNARLNSLKHLPTPDPTSSTIPVESSPPRRALARPGLQRTESSVSARVPLGNVRSAELRANGEPTLFGRSSNSSHFQLSANRHISRVHVEASYQGPTADLEFGQVVIKCLGWNGARITCRGQAFELAKGDTFSSDKPHAEIMLDVQDARVLVQWPPVRADRAMSTFSDATHLADETPVQTPRQAFASSPPVQMHLHSPVSPSPRRLASMTASQTFIGLPLGDASPVQVYEDSPSGDEGAGKSDAQLVKPDEPLSQENKASQNSSLLSSPDDLSDNDEENDPIVHSFGPFGANLSARLASFATASPARHREPLRTSVSPMQRAIAKPFSPLKSKALTESQRDFGPIKNHVINQLAYSRLQSMPLSSIFNNLPASWKVAEDQPQVESEDGPQKSDLPLAITQAELKVLLEETPAVGEIARSGKDAAGKALENEFYYVPEMDADEMRKTAVASSLGKPGMRNARKQHKVSIFALDTFDTWNGHANSPDHSNITGRSREHS